MMSQNSRLGSLSLIQRPDPSVRRVFLCSLPVFSHSHLSVDELRPLRQESAPDPVEIGQRNEREYPGRGRGDRVDDPPPVGADRHLHAEIPLIALLRLAHLRVAGPVPILGRGRRVDDHGIDQGSGLKQETLLREQLVYGRKDRPGQPLPLQEPTEVQDRGLVGDRLVPELDPREAAHRFAVVERVLGCRVGEAEPLLPKIDAQHRFERHRLAPVAGLGIVRFDEAKERVPRHHRVHLLKKPLAASQLLLMLKGQRCKGRLLHPGSPQACAGGRVSLLDTETCSGFPL